MASPTEGAYIQKPPSLAPLGNVERAVAGISVVVSVALAAIGALSLLDIGGFSNALGDLGTVACLAGAAQLLFLTVVISYLVKKQNSLKSGLLTQNEAALPKHGVDVALILAIALTVLGVVVAVALNVAPGDFNSFGKFLGTSGSYVLLSSASTLLIASISALIYTIKQQSFSPSPRVLGSGLRKKAVAVDAPAQGSGKSTPTEASGAESESDDSSLDAARGARKSRATDQSPIEAHKRTRPLRVEFLRSGAVPENCEQLVREAQELREVAFSEEERSEVDAQVMFYHITGRVTWSTVAQEAESIRQKSPDKPLFVIFTERYDSERDIRQLEEPTGKDKERIKAVKIERLGGVRIRRGAFVCEGDEISPFRKLSEQLQARFPPSAKRSSKTHL